MKAIAKLGPEGFLTNIVVGDHSLVADEPTDKGGTNQGPTAFGLLASALATCTAATIRSYANLKSITLDSVIVEVEAARRTPAQQKEAGEDAKATWVSKRITINSDMTEEQRERMLQVAEKCPINRALTEGVDFI